MNNEVKIVLSIIAVLVTAVLAVCGVSYVSAANYGASTEARIKAVHANNQNILAQYGQKVAEAAQVTDMARDDISKVVKDAIGGRYGDGGSKAVVQWIKEQNPTVDPALYRKVQQIVESGRNEFQQGQTSLIDVKRSYEANLQFFWRGKWLDAAGYPKIVLADYKAITTDRAEGAFRAGKEAGIIQLRPAAKQ